jgi:pullulanase
MATVIAARLDGDGYAGAGYRSIVYLINVDKVAQKIAVPEEAGRRYRLHPAQASAHAGDKRVRDARYDAAGSFTVPARTAVVFVEALPGS